MEALYKIARDITLKYAGASSKWKHGDDVTHPDGRTVRILSGYYLDPTYGRVSNWWRWQPVGPDGELGEVEHGYGWDALAIATGSRRAETERLGAKQARA